MSSANPQFHPCLPKAFLDELNKDPIVTKMRSHIYDEQFERFRVKALSQKESCEIECILGNVPDDLPTSLFPPRIMNKIDLFVKGQNRTFLHLAAKRADILLAYESIRIGTSINWKDKDGITALMLACFQVRVTKAVKDAVKGTKFPPEFARESAEALSNKSLDSDIECYRRIASLLIEQHADVNVAVEDETPLSVAAEAACWPLVELLIRHGATIPSPGQPCYPIFSTKTHQSRFNSIVRATQCAKPRPLRPCPCWSGKLLKDCHADKDIPYPESYLCRCGRPKTYANCCAKKNGFSYNEKWNAEDDCIIFLESRTLSMPEDDAFRTGFAHSFDFITRLGQLGQADKVKIAREFGPMSAAMFSHLPPEEFDRGYLHALASCDFMPRPWTGHISKVESTKRMSEWNAAVDAYIALGTDRRPKYDIELKSKIGLNGGPLYKHCEAQGCGKSEGRDVEKMKCCSSCKLIVYCSQACQVTDWPLHKAACKKKAHKEQLLPAQKVMEDTINEHTREMAGLDVNALLAGALGGMQMSDEVD